jgi:predicted  nucleic acid-binding Zn-ribbon protein
MEFRDYATKEASASVRRAFTRSSEASRQQLDAVRTALDAAAKALASIGPGGPEDQDVADLAGRLTKAAASAAEQAAKQAAEEAQKGAKQAADEAQKAAKQAADEAQKAADALRAELQAAVKQKMAVAASLKEAQTQAETLRVELKTATDRGEVASRQLGEARKTNEKHEAARAELTASCDELARARGASENELHKARAALDAARGDLALAAKKYEKIAADNTRLEDSIGVAHSQSEASEAKLSAVTDLFKQSAARVKVLEKAQQDQERVVRDLEARLKDRPAAAAVVTAPAGASLVLLDDLLAGFQALGDATTITDVLRTLVEQLAAQFPRVALFRVKKTHLQGEHQIGFDLKTDIAKVVMPLGMDSLLARAASSGTIERLSANELKDSSRAPFSGTPGSALAVPIMVNGEPLAIVYADDAGKTAGGGGAAEYDVNARFAEAMQQHASALVARLTNELKALAELQAYASSLLHELEQMHAADVQAGMAAEELPARLKGNLEYACSIYNSRIALEGADAAALLDDALAALLDAKQGTPFGRDLAVAAGRPDLPARSAAEAS